jgi:hypothetical protein
MRKSEWGTSNGAAGRRIPEFKKMKIIVHLDAGLIIPLGQSDSAK